MKGLPTERYPRSSPRLQKKKERLFLILILCLPLLFVSPVSPAAQDYGDRDIISLSGTEDILSKLNGLSLDFLMEWKGRVYIVASPTDLVRLQERNIPYVLESDRFYRRLFSETAAQTSLNGAFHSYAETERELMTLAQDHPLIARVVDLGDSLEGRNIYALKISRNVHLDENKPAMLITGCHHAREWISVEVALLFCRHLLENDALNADIKALIDSGEVWVVPVVNPDGLEYSIHSYRYWRKNRRNNGTASFGVDLNRNYGHMWGYDEVGSRSDPDSEVYRGTGAFSEPESQAIRDLFSRRDFRALISYHSYSQVILYPWGYKHDPSIDEGLLAGLARQMADLMRPVNGRDYGVERAGDGFYLTNGDTTDWAYGAYGVPAYTIELPPVDQLYGGFFNSEADIQSIFAENLPAMLFLLNWTVSDSGSDLPFRSDSPKTDTKRKPAKIKSPRR